MPNSVATPYPEDLVWPAHLRPFDPLDHTIQADPYPYYEWMREHAPVLRTKTSLGEAWFLSRYRDVVGVLRSHKIFSSELYDPKKAPQVLFMDEPDHMRLRAAVAHIFTPKAVAKLEEKIRSLAGQYFHPLLGEGIVEIVESFAAPLTLDMITILIGLPLSETDQFRRWSQDWGSYSGRLSGNSPGSPTDEAGTMAFVEYMRQTLERVPADGDSILSSIVRARAQGKLTDQEAQFFTLVLFTAGHETTTILIANGLIQLAETPELLTRLRENPGDIPAFVEELARYKPPIHRLRRITTREVEVGGHTIPAHAHVRLLIVAANRDPEKFPNPELFDLGRDTGGHLGFGFGIHSCLGSWLARLEARIIFELIAQTVSKIELYPDAARAVVPFTGGSMSASGPRLLTLRLSRT
jgi:cytochrome P450